MPTYIIHHEGVYNFFSTILDAPCYDGGLTREEVEEITKEESGNQGLNDLPQRLGRAHANGCSELKNSLESCIATNRAGPGESKLSREEFIRQYLTLPVSR